MITLDKNKLISTKDFCTEMGKLIFYFDKTIDTIEEVTSLLEKAIHEDPPLTLKEGSIIDEKLFNKILENLKDRTNNKCLAILGRANQTKKTLIDKLLLAGYNEKIVEDIVDKMEKEHYINDKDFAINYFENNKKRKSIKIIKNTLISKGISKEIIEEVIDDEFDQKEQIQKLIDKKLKGRNFEDLDYKEKAKIKAYLYSKGFNFNDF